MKSLILKDVYNISHNAKSMLFLLALFAVCFIPTGVEQYISVAALLCGMMIVTTFSFDDKTGWDVYALVMPVSRRQVVGTKFAVLALFCTLGAAIGLAAGAVGGSLTG